MIRACGKLQEQRERVTVYGLLAEGDTHYRYIGQTAHALCKRLSWHRNQALNGKSQSFAVRWIRKVLCAGRKLTIHAIEDNAEPDVAEIKWIAHYRSLYDDMTNISFGGTGGVKGIKRSEETLCKLRKPKSPLTREKMRKPKSHETRQKMSEAQRGNKKSLGEFNPRATLTEDDVREIVKQLDQGLSLTTIGTRYNVQKSAISKIKNGRSWTHVTQRLCVT